MRFHTDVGFLFLACSYFLSKCIFTSRSWIDVIKSFSSLKSLNFLDPQVQVRDQI